MVRLLLVRGLGWQLKRPEFQSHNGAIAANRASVGVGSQPEFQSHNGAIAAGTALHETARRRKFQSHNGAIAALLDFDLGLGFLTVSIPQWCDCCRTRRGCWLKDCRFQSHNGAIAAWHIRAAKENIWAVSIPQWCDCCAPKATIVACGNPRFNPTMVRLLPRQNFGV